jgi:Leucine-rich repeat (LRR) protein
VIPASTVVNSLSLDKLGIKDLTGLKFFPELTTLSCQGNSDLTSIDLSVVPKLKKLLIVDCNVTSLDFTNNPDMIYIDCSNSKNAGKLASINVSKCSGLTHLALRGNKIDILDVTHNPELKMLSFYKNNLTTIDLSKNTRLDTLYANNNPKLTSLDLTNNTDLTYLSVYSNNMPKLNVTKLTNLKSLLCFSNKLKELDVTHNSQLEYLSCYVNQLSQLDLSKNQSLKSLLCFNNKLKELDLTKNTALTDVSCYGNQLTSLDLRVNKDLTFVDCSNNKLTSLTLPSVDTPNMTFLNVHDNALASLNLNGFSKLKAQSGKTKASAAKQCRRMKLYTDGTDVYMRVGGGIDASKISDAKITTGNTSTSIDFSVGTEANGLVPLKFSNGAVRKRLFNWTGTKASPVTITYNYDTESTLSGLKTMDVTDTVECYMLPMSQEYGSVNLPYDVVLPEGATAYAISNTNVKEGSDDNTATLTQIAVAGEVVKANTPMLIRRSSSTSTLFALNNSTGTAKTAATNMLKGTQDAAIDNKDSYYVLGINNTAISPDVRGKLGFWRSSNTKIGNWRAYLDLGTVSNAKGFVLSLDDSTTTSISQIETAEDRIKTPWYTLDGRVLGGMPSQRGIYIHNGKKIIISK